MSNDINRRKFIGQASCSAVGTASLFSTLLSLRMTAGAASGGPISGYKAMVCLFLGGGNDSYNMLVPRQTDAYNEYAAVRTNLALPSGDLLPITSTGQSYSEFGIHPNLPYLQSLYNSNDAAFVANVGTLVQPTSITEYNNKSVTLPTGLFSHSDEKTHWQTVVPEVRGAGPKGWAGRLAECMDQANSTGQIALNLSLSGNNILQTGPSSVPYITSHNGVTLLDDYDPDDLSDPATAAVDTILGNSYKNLYKKTLSINTRASIDTGVAFDEAVSPLSTTETFPDSQTGDRLGTIAKVIQARGPLGMDRQIFFVERGGWDHHNGVLAPQVDLFGELNAAIEAFWKEMGHLGLQDDVILFTASDFARTLTSNGAGSDHAWGGNHFVIGGDVNGGKIYGQYPVLATGGPLDINRGRILPTTSVDEYGTEMASWFGVPSGELDVVFPNSTRFFDPNTTPHPLGILS